MPGRASLAPRRVSLALRLLLAAGMAPVALHSQSAASGIKSQPLYAAFEPFTGRSSYYGAEFAGRKTANGEIFDPELFTAAHRYLAFGTMLLVTNTQTGAQVVVRVNDRGPFVGDRKLDLSRAAGLSVGMLATGTAVVRVEPAPKGARVGPVGRSDGGARKAAAGMDWADITVASYSTRKSAEEAATFLLRSGFDPTIETGGGHWRVKLLRVAADDAASARMRLAGLGFKGAIVKVHKAR